MFLLNPVVAETHNRRIHLWVEWGTEKIAAQNLCKYALFICVDSHAVLD
jgi:hypothetical protein